MGEKPPPEIEANRVATHLKGGDTGTALHEMNTDLQGMGEPDRKKFFDTLAKRNQQEPGGLPGLVITDQNHQLKVQEKGQNGAVLYDETPGGADNQAAARRPADRAAPAAPPSDAAPAAPPPSDAAPAAPPAAAGDDLSPKLRRGEGPYQALHRMHPDWDNTKLQTESHRILQQTGRTSFNQGEQFRLNDDGSVTSHQADRHDPNSYSETTSKDGKPVLRKTHVADQNGGYTEHTQAADGSTIDSTYDKTKGVIHTEAVDADKNKTVADQNADGSYTEQTTNAAGQETYRETGNADKSKVERVTDPATGAYTEKTLNPDGKETKEESVDKDKNKTVKDIEPATGAYTEHVTDATGKAVSDTTHTPTANGFQEVTHKDGQTITTTHTDTATGYTEHTENTNGTTSSTTYDKASTNAHTETVDKDGNKTVRDQKDDGSFTSKTTDIKGRETESETGDTNHNKTVKTTEPTTGAYTEKTTNAQGQETYSESVDKNHIKEVKTTDPATGAYNEVTTNAKGQEIHSEVVDANHKKSVKDTEPATGAYSERTTDASGKEIYTEKVDKDHNKTVRTTDPTNGSYSETKTDAQGRETRSEVVDPNKNKTIKTTDAATGSYMERTTDAQGHLTDDKRHTARANGFSDLEHKGNTTIETVHTDDGKGGYRETTTNSDGSQSTTTYDKATKIAHTESTDKDHNKTIRDQNDDGTFTSATTDAHGKPIAGSQQLADGSKGSWQINPDQSTSFMHELNGHRQETTFKDGKLTKSVDTDLQSHVVQTAVHADGKVITTTQTPGQPDVVQTAPEAAAPVPEPAVATG